MLTLGPLAFAAPWVLLALALLPPLYWLLRMTPPAPRHLSFPAIRLLFDLVKRDETPARTPIWLLILRLIIAALLIGALAQPILNPETRIPGSGPVLVIVDDGWAAADGWTQRQSSLAEIIDRAGRADRPLILARSAPPEGGGPPAITGPMAAAELRRLVDGLAPHPWSVDRGALADALTERDWEGRTHSVWLADGVATAADGALANALQAMGTVEVVFPGRNPVLLRPPASALSDLVVAVDRVAARDGGDRPETLSIVAMADDGGILARERAAFGAGARTAEARFALPTEARNAVARLSVEDRQTAGATVLLDRRWQRHRVGLVTDGDDPAQPLLSEHHYLRRALQPFADLVEGTVDDLIERETDVLIVPDGLIPPAGQTGGLEAWVADGGVLIRFAGPGLASGGDALTPAPLREGDRLLSGAMSWTEPMPLADFAPDGPFQGLEPPADVLVLRQVLAEPTPAVSRMAWARLADGTPLVTGTQRAHGWLVLFHVTARPDWSNLPLSGVFVDMLRRVVDLGSGNVGESGSQHLAPSATLDAWGTLGPPAPNALPVDPLAFGAEPAIGPRTPPGLYGPPDNQFAVNVGAATAAFEPLVELPLGATVSAYGTRSETSLLPWILAAALILAAIDAVVSLWLRGALSARPQSARPQSARPQTVSIAGAAGLSLLAVIAWPGPSHAQIDDATVVEMVNNTYLAYVVTGDGEVDRVSEAGLESLTRVLRLRTAAETMGAVGIDPTEDELAFFPLIYWPMTETQGPLSPTATERINRYLRQGGVILFDTRDQQQSGSASLLGPTPGIRQLRVVTASLDLPALTPVPPEHVLTRAFYLMQDFPGRLAGGRVWVEDADARVNDGVSSVIVGSNDWAAAWAVDQTGRPLRPVVPGGERQREMAYRFGVNVVMYALTGNYKADQVHVPAILERLGQ